MDVAIKDLENPLVKIRCAFACCRHGVLPGHAWRRWPRGRSSFERLGEGVASTLATYASPANAKIKLECAAPLAGLPGWRRRRMNSERVLPNLQFLPHCICHRVRVGITGQILMDALLLMRNPPHATLVGLSPSPQREQVKLHRLLALRSCGHEQCAVCLFAAPIARLQSVLRWCACSIGSRQSASSVRRLQMCPPARCGFRSSCFRWSRRVWHPSHIGLHQACRYGADGVPLRHAGRDAQFAQVFRLDAPGRRGGGIS